MAIEIDVKTMMKVGNHVGRIGRQATWHLAVPRPEPERVGTGAASKCVFATPAKKRVVAGAAVQVVISESTIQEIVAVASIEIIVPIGAEQRVSAVRTVKRNAFKERRVMIDVGQLGHRSEFQGHFSSPSYPDNPELRCSAR